MSARWPAGWRGGTGGRSLSRPGTAARIRRSGCSTAPYGTPGGRWAGCAGSRWRAWMRRPRGRGGAEPWGSGRWMRPARAGRGRARPAANGRTWGVRARGRKPRGGVATRPRRWEVRSAGAGSKGQRWYAWAWLDTASPAHHLLIRRHLKTGELAFHYCFVPKGQRASMARLIRAAGLRWPVEEDFEFGKDCFGLDQSPVRLYTAIARHTVLVLAPLAACAVTAALLPHPTDTPAPAPVTPDQPPPSVHCLIPPTV